MDIITYETIRAVHRAEKEDSLQELPKNFFESVKNWLTHKQNQKDTASLLELENAKKLVEDIINRRERKIVLAALRTLRGEMPPRNLTDSEQKFFDEIVNSLKSFRQNTSEQILGYERIIEDKIESAKSSMDDLKNLQSRPNGKMLVKVLIEVPRFVGSDMQYYGPLKIGDVLSLPNEVADILISRKAAESILD